MSVNTQHNIAEVGGETLDQLIASRERVLVDFWAPWCAPCLALAPALESLAAEAGDEVRVVKVNIDEHPDQARRFGVRSIPTLVLFQNGEPTATRFGVQSRNNLQELFGTTAH